MEYRLLPIFATLILIVVGYIQKRMMYENYQQRIYFTINFHDNFIQLADYIYTNKSFDLSLYNKCIHDVDKIQRELGEDGIITEYVDWLKGIKYKNYQLFINVIPEMRMMVNMLHTKLMKERYDQLIGLCEDSLRRHVGNLDRFKEELKYLLNPIACFGEGIRWILSLPINILIWLGVMGPHRAYIIHKNIVFKLISNTITIVGLISSIITIILGWNDTVMFFSDLHVKFKIL